MTKKKLPQIPKEEESFDSQESKDLAEKESMGFSSGNLKEEADVNAHNRREGFRDEISRAAKCIFWLAVIGIASLFLTWMWHLVTPECWHYINSEQRMRIETILFSGALAAMVSEFSRKYL